MDTEYIADEHELQVAIASLDRADKSRAEISNKSRKGLAEYSDKILLYAAGAFSFQITLLQFVPDKHILAKVGVLGQPHIYLMYGSMFLYLLTCGLILASKKLDTYYLSSHSGENYSEKLLKERESILSFAEKYPMQIKIQGGVENQINVYKDDITKIKAVIAKNRFSSSFYLKCVQLCRSISDLTVFIATLFLFLFAVQLAQALVW